MRYIIITLYSIGFFLWIIRKIYYVHDDTEAFFLLLWQLNFDVFVGTFFAFCYFLLKNDFDIFHVLLSPAFLCVLDDSYFPFLWIEKKIIINLSFFCMLQKLTLLYELCKLFKLYELYKLYELRKLCEFCKRYELCKLYQLCELYDNVGRVFELYELSYMSILWIA